MKIPLVDLHSQYQAYKSEIDAAIQRVIENSSFILGSEVKTFEQHFAEFSSVRYAVGVDSGTAALHLALLLLDCKPGDEVITTTHTFIATAEVIALTGAKPVFVDIDPRTYNLDPKQVEAAITPRTKVILPVHLYGQPAEMDAIMDIAKRHNLRVVEDAAQAHGATYRGQHAGSIGDIACFSFYPGKNLGGYGDGGMLTTNDPALAERARMLRNHGRKDKYEHEVIGYGYRLDALQAAILDVKLQHLEAWNNKRREHAAYYNQLLDALDIHTPYEPAHLRGIYHIYAIEVERRDELLAHLKARGIEAGVHYPIPLHLQPAFKELGYPRGAFPLAEHAAAHELSLPMYPELTREQIEYVVEAIKEFGG
ncbi:MAG: DegT/DnrJ/EryC1/StrS family aminotransferase [Anaerolineae bacterium]